MSRPLYAQVNLTALRSNLAQVRSRAPDTQVLAVVKASDYDVTAMVTTPEFATLTDTFSSSEFTDAQDSFRKYVASTCGITSNTDPVTSSDLTTTSGS